MNAPSEFSPLRTPGLVFQAGISLILLAASGFCFWQALSSKVGGIFLVYLFLALVFLAPLPLLIYRLYGLTRSYYHLERDGLQLRWGLRTEDIPFNDIEWIRPASDFTALVPEKNQRAAHIPLPWLRWPGALLGTLNLEGLGPIEFLASDSSRLLLVATPRKIFAISPADPAAFVKAFTHITELGSLSPLPHHSVYPTFLIGRAWQNRWARWMILGGFALGLALLVWVSLVIPTRAAFPLGFNPDGTPLEPSPSPRLLLLPVLNGMTYLIDLAGGLFFYRRPEQKPLAYLLWAGSILTPAVMLVAVSFILRA